MLRLIHIIVFSLILSQTSYAAFSGGDNDKEGKSSVSIKGKVVDWSDKEPLVGVKVYIKELDLIVYSDLEGNFEFNNLPSLNYKLHFSLTSFNDKSIKGKSNKDPEDSYLIKLFPN